MFAQKIKELRKSKNLSQVQFAKQFGIASGTVAMWETGKRTPRHSMLLKIAKYFNVSVDYLLDNSSLNNSPQLESVYYNLALQAQREKIPPNDIWTVLQTLTSLKRK